MRKVDSFVASCFTKYQNTASVEVIKTIETTRKFQNRKIFAKLNEHISETFLALKCMFLAFKHMFLALKCTF